MSPLYIDKTTFINSFMVGLWEKMNFEPYSNNEIYEKIRDQIYEKIRDQFDSSLSKAELSSSFNKNSTPHGYEEFLNGFKQSLIDSNIVLEKTRFENSLKIELFKTCINSGHKFFDEKLCTYRISLETMKEQGIL